MIFIQSYTFIWLRGVSNYAPAPLPQMKIYPCQTKQLAKPQQPQLLLGEPEDFLVFATEMDFGIKLCVDVRWTFSD